MSRTSSSKRLAPRQGKMQELQAIREGAVHAIIVSGSKGEQVFSQTGAESVYRLIVETMKEAALTVSLDGTILFCNGQFGELVKKPLERIVGRPVAEFVVPENRAHAAALLASSQDEPVRSRVVFQRPDGTAVPAHVSSTVLRQPDCLSICVVATDLTELETSTEMLQLLRVQQEALAQSEQRYRELVELSPQAILVHSGGTVVYVNPAGIRLYGAKGPEELAGRAILDLVHPEYRSVIAERIRCVLEQRAQTPIAEAKILHLDGHAVDVEITATGITYEGMPAVQVILGDISLRRQAQEQLKQTLAELARSNQELEQFAYAASHDLQEPLRMVAWYTQLLAQRYQDRLDQDAKEFIAFAVDGATRMQRLIQDLLDYSRVSTHGTGLGSTDAQHALQDALGNLQTAIHETGAHVTHDRLPMVLADHAQLVQVFQNLVGNAIKFHGEAPPRVHVSATPKDDTWVFAVRDNGIGIAPEYFDRIFRIFQRLHPVHRYPGTGIGLALCQRIVQQHGGRIWVESTPGQGATFSFTLKGQERLPT